MLYIAIVDRARRKMGEQWITRKEAASFLSRLGCTMSYYTLSRLAVGDNRGSGPPFVRSRSGRVLYHVNDLRKWAADTTVRVE